MSEASRAWSWRHAIAKSGLPATTRHVLLTLSLYMDETGRSCFPSIAEIVDSSGLDKKTVRAHLDGAAACGWIGVADHGFRGQRWRRREYVAKWPDRGAASASLFAQQGQGAAGASSGIADDDGEDGTQEYSNPGAAAAAGEGGGATPPASPPGEAGELAPQGGGIDAPKVGEPLPQDKNSPKDHSSSSPERAREEAGKSSDGRTVLAFQALWPKAILDNGQKTRSAWDALTPAERQRALEFAPTYLAEFAEQKGGRRTPAWAYLEDRPWVIAAAAAAAASPPPAPITPPPASAEVRLEAFGRQWWVMWFRVRPVDRTHASMASIRARQYSIGWKVPGGEAPTEEEAAAFVAIPVNGEEHRAWLKHLGTRQIFDMPTPERAQWLFVPTQWPPDAIQPQQEREAAW